MSTAGPPVGPELVLFRHGETEWSSAGRHTGRTDLDLTERGRRQVDGMGAVVSRLAIVAHGHVLRILAARWVGLDPREGRRFVLDTATLSLLGWERENRVIRRWNDPCGW